MYTDDGFKESISCCASAAGVDDVANGDGARADGSQRQVDHADRKSSRREVTTGPRWRSSPSHRVTTTSCEVSVVVVDITRRKRPNVERRRRQSGTVGRNQVAESGLKRTLHYPSLLAVNIRCLKVYIR